MKPLKCYVGLNGKFVMCENFPNDEDHQGLHEMLEEFIGYDDYLQNEPLEQGFYLIDFKIEDNYPIGHPDAEYETYLVAEKITRMEK